MLCDATLPLTWTGEHQAAAAPWSLLAVSAMLAQPSSGPAITVVNAYCWRHLMPRHEPIITENQRILP